MTEGNREKPLARLQGEVEALREMVDLLLVFMPNAALMRAESRLGYLIDAGTKARDADAAHLNWDMASRSRFPPLPEEKPFVTARAEGYLETLSDLRLTAETTLAHRREEDNWPGIIAQTPEGRREEEAERLWRQESAADD